MKNEKELSKFLALILRHKPETIGITLDSEGWTSVYQLIDGMNKQGYPINMATLKAIVERDTKSRYSFNENETKIRANQGHSANVCYIIHIE